VNGLDLALLLGEWGPGKDAEADFDGSGGVDGLDLAVLLGMWGKPTFALGGFPDDWISGAPSCSPQPLPLIQVHVYNDDTYILRQSKCTNFEGPCMYLLFGEDKVLLEDTGAGFPSLPLATTVYGLIDDWLAAHEKESIQLIVAHSHSHGDHIGHDSQFTGQPNTTVVGTSLSAVQAFWGYTAATWPTEIHQYDLGGRILDIIAIPGHHATHIAIYDRNSHLLLTGDTLYPGFLFISSFSQYKTSIQRLVDFTEDNPVCWVLGTHIEMSAVPGIAYPYGTVYQPNEHVLQLTRDHLVELNEALIAMGVTPHDEVHDDFIISP
jgi:glyoxylase-like metal-dependent hydrolase (beta-lactamase superfamily II)